jgi:hypothetical protein
MTSPYRILISWMSSNMCGSSAVLGDFAAFGEDACSGSGAGAGAGDAFAGRLIPARSETAGGGRKLARTTSGGEEERDSWQPEGV